MIDQYMNNFMGKLLEMTENKQINWKRLSIYSKLILRSRELDDYLKLANNEYNEILIESSYFIKSDERFLVLLKELSESGFDGTKSEILTLYAIAGEREPMINLNKSYALSDRGMSFQEELEKLYDLIVDYIGNKSLCSNDVRTFLNEMLPGDHI